MSSTPTRPILLSCSGLVCSPGRCVASISIGRRAASTGVRRILRLYGLTKKQYMELRPYIHISSDYEPAASMIPQETYEPTYAHKPYKEYDRDTVRFPIKIKAGEHVNVALADTSMLKKVPGIGSGWARHCELSRAAGRLLCCGAVVGNRQFSP